MKKIIIGLALLIPSHASTANYSRIIHQDVVVETRGDRVVATERSGLSKRIERFIRLHHAPPDLAPAMAETLANSKYPRLLAGIPVREKTLYRTDVVGAVGEIGAYQVRPEIWGHPGNDIFSQIRKSEEIIIQLADESKGSLAVAVRKYNGSGKQAWLYSRDVLRLAKSI